MTGMSHDQAEYIFFWDNCYTNFNLYCILCNAMASSYDVGTSDFYDELRLFAKIAIQNYKINIK